MLQLSFKKFILPIIGGAILGAFSLSSALPAGFTAVQVGPKTGLKFGTAIAEAPDGRIFYTEATGAVKAIKGDVATTITTVLTSTGTENGLLKVVVHPNFATNGWIYIYYTSGDGKQQQIDRIKVDANSAMTDSKTIFSFAINGLQFHNGSAMTFKDGFLYFAKGNHGNTAAAHDWKSYYGHVFRLTEDGAPAPGNPHYATAGANDAEKSTWALGMRNPWSMSVDPITNRLLCTNVGEGTEEINDITAPDAAKGYDFGGIDHEGIQTAYISPLYFYKTNGGMGNSPVSSIVYNPPVTNWPAEYKGLFFTNDYNGSKKFSTVPLKANGTSTSLDDAASGVKPFHDCTTCIGTILGNNGNIYYIKNDSYNGFGSNAAVYQISYGPVGTLSKPSLSMRNFSLKMGVQNEINFSLNGAFSTQDINNATFSIIGADGKTYFSKPITITNSTLQVQGFEPKTSGVFVGQLHWNSQGADHVANGRLVVLP